MNEYVAGALLGAVFGLLSFWRWPMVFVLSAITLWASWSGLWYTLAYAMLFAGELVSAWTGEYWAPVVWRVLRQSSATKRDWTRELELASVLDMMDAIRAQEKPECARR